MSQFYPQPKEIWRFAQVYTANNGSTRIRTQGLCPFSKTSLHGMSPVLEPGSLLAT